MKRDEKQNTITKMSEKGVRYRSLDKMLLAAVKENTIHNAVLVKKGRISLGC
jgi:hypothetical protein